MYSNYLNDFGQNGMRASPGEGDPKKHLMSICKSHSSLSKAFLRYRIDMSDKYQPWGKAFILKCQEN